MVADRGREQRSQIVLTSARGGAMVFWQSPRSRRQARPDVRLPTARAAGVTKLEILVDTHERYAYTFAGEQVRTVTRGLACGDCAISVAGKVAAVERKSLPDLVSSLTSGRLRFALGELATLPRAALVVDPGRRQRAVLRPADPARAAPPDLQRPASRSKRPRWRCRGAATRRLSSELGSTTIADAVVTRSRASPRVRCAACVISAVGRRGRSGDDAEGWGWS